MMHGGGGGGGGAGEGGGGGVGGGRNIFKAAREPLCPHVDACRTRHHTRTRCSLGALQYPMKQKLRRQRSKRPWRRAAPVIGKVCARLPSSAVVERTHCHGLKKGARRARYRTLARDSAFHEFSRMSPRFTRSRVKSRNAQGSARARLTNPAPQRRGTVPRPGVGRRWGRVLRPRSGRPSDPPPSQKARDFGWAKHPGATYSTPAPLLRVRMTFAAKRRPGRPGRPPLRAVRFLWRERATGDD